MRDLGVFSEVLPHLLQDGCQANSRDFNVSKFFNVSAVTDPQLPQTLNPCAKPGPRKIHKYSPDLDRDSWAHLTCLNIIYNFLVLKLQ